MLLQLVVSGLAMGAIYGLIALGFTLIWNAVGIVNFAQGDLVMLGAYISVGWLDHSLHLPWTVNALLMLAAMAVAGFLLARLVYHPVRNAAQLAAIVATLGLSLALENGAVLVWGPEPMTYPGPFGNATVTLGTAKIYDQDLLIIAVLVLLMALQTLMFRRTTWGKAMRATAQDREMARLMGVRTDRVIAVIFAYAAVLAGVAGVLLAPIFYVSSTMGSLAALKAFAASIIGGFGNVVGAVVGGLLLGVVESLGSYFLTPQYIDVISFGLLILFLVARPQGIFGEPEMERP
ncbi:MAG: branched-chain amino acid ABC transporter permease [Actinomycetia bacterium]|nr:branched-chain amino acid ABC transporter permease [Actinomycetes bacterium]